MWSSGYLRGLVVHTNVDLANPSSLLPTFLPYLGLVPRLVHVLCTRLCRGDDLIIIPSLNGTCIAPSPPCCVVRRNSYAPYVQLMLADV